MDKKNIIFNHTLEQYNKKYKNRNYRLIRFTKKQVEEFDKLHNTSNNYLLKDRKWWFIKDTYYEIPKPIRFTWFRNLNVGVQTAVCVLGAGVVATAVTVPLVLMNQNKEDTGDKMPDIEISESIKSSIEIKDKKFIGDNLEMTLSIKDDKKEFTGEIKVTVGNTILKEKDEYNFNKDNGKLSIKKSIIIANKDASIIIEPTLKDKVLTTTYNVDWCKTPFIEGKTIAQLIETELDDDYQIIYDGAHEIKFVQDDDENIKPGEVCIGETASDKVYASWIGNPNYTLTIRSKGKVVFGDEDNPYDSEYDYYIGVFGNIQKLTKITLDNIDTSKMTNFSGMFSYMGFDYLDKEYSLDLDLSKIDTSKATRMDYMFYYFYGDKLDVSSLKTSNVTNMEGMFSSLKHLSSLNCEGLDTSKVVNMDQMFSWSYLKEIDISTLVTSNVTSMNLMFYCMNYLTTIYASDLFKTDNVPNDQNLFGSSYRIVGGKGTSSFTGGTNKAYARIDEGPDSEHPGYFTDVAQKTYKIDWATTKFTDATAGFNNETVYDKAKTATQIKFEKNSNTTGGVCVGEKDDAGKQDPVYASYTTDGTDNILTVWSSCKIAFENDDRPGTGGISGFFNDCNKITSLKLNNISTSEVTDFSLTFYNCEVLETIEGLNNLDTKKAVSMNLMFYQYRKLKEIDLSSFVTTNVTTMSSMFESCETITTLNLSLFDTSNVTNMLQMFLNSHELETIYTSQLFSTSNLTPSTGDYYMFANCTNLKGGKGTGFDSEIIDKTRAKIDEGAGNLGYFTGVNHFCLTQYDSVNMILTYGSKLNLDSKYGCDVFGSCEETGWYSCPASLSVKVNGEIVPINSVIDINSVKLYYGNDAVAFTIEEDKISNDNPTMSWGGSRLCFTFKLLKSIDNVEFIINCQ